MEQFYRSSNKWVAKGNKAQFSDESIDFMRLPTKGIAGVKYVTLKYDPATQLTICEASFEGDPSLYGKAKTLVHLRDLMPTFDAFGILGEPTRLAPKNTLALNETDAIKVNNILVRMEQICNTANNSSVSYTKAGVAVVVKNVHEIDFFGGWSIASLVQPQLIRLEYGLGELTVEFRQTHDQPVEVETSNPQKRRRIENTDPQFVMND